MFAILIAPENMPEILQNANDSVDDLETTLSTYLRHSANWYFVIGYISRLGSYLSWSVLPQYILDDKFEYDPEKIKTDWDQIVRK